MEIELHIFLASEEGNKEKVLALARNSNPIVHLTASPLYSRS
jgi:hypothetical protein